MTLPSDVLLRILAAIISESVVFTICCVVTVTLMFRYKNNKKPQLGNMVYFFILYGLAIAASITGKVLTYLKQSYELDNTEWGIFTNWSLSLGFIALSLFYQLEVSWDLFRPKIENYRLYARAGSAVLFLIVFIIPRYDINNQELSIMYSLKFIFVFIYVLAASLYYMINTYKVYTFIQSKFLQRRILAGLVFYSCIILVFVFFMISSIFGEITGIYYTWGYFISISFMLGAAFAGFFMVKQGKESDRQEIDHELQKLLQNRKKTEENQK